MKHIKSFNESILESDVSNNNQYTASKLIDKLKRINFINGTLLTEKGEKGVLYTGVRDGYNIRVIINSKNNILDNTFDINISNSKDLSTKGFNSYDEDSDAVDIFFKDILTIVKDLNK